MRTNTPHCEFSSLLRSRIAPVALWLVTLLVPVAVQAQIDIGRPDTKEGPTRVDMGVYVLDVDEVNTAVQSFTANVYFEAAWDDPRLAHNGTDAIRRPLTEVWHPRLQFVSQQRVFATFPETVEILPSGRVTYRQRVWGSFSQPLNLREFPFDRQELAIGIVSVGYRPTEVELVPVTEASGRRSGIADDFSLPDWQVIGWRTEASRFRPFPDAEGLPQFVLTITVGRYSKYFTLKVIVPLCLIVAMSWVAFWVDAREIGTNISVVITGVLTLVAYRFAIGDTLPAVAYLTRMDQFILLSTLLVFAGLAQVVVNSTLVRRGRVETAHKIDRWSRLAYPLVFVGIVLWSLVL